MASIFFKTSYGNIINIMARTARVPPALTAVLEKIKIIFKKVYQNLSILIK